MSIEALNAAPTVMARLRSLIGVMPGGANAGKVVRRGVALVHLDLANHHRRRCVGSSVIDWRVNVLSSNVDRVESASGKLFVPGGAA